MSSFHNVTPAAVVRLARRCARCGCPLSRYNNELRCGSCARGIPRQISRGVHVPDTVWADEDLQQALAVRDFGRLCRLVRERVSLRQEDVASLTGLSQAFLSMLESGARRLTNIDKIIQLVDGLGVPADLRGIMLVSDTDAASTESPPSSAVSRWPT